MVNWLPKWALPKTFANQSRVRNYHGNYWDTCVTFFSLLPPNMWFDDQNYLGPQYTEKYGPVCLAPVVCSCHPSSQHELFQASLWSWLSLKIFCLQPCKPLLCLHKGWCCQREWGGNVHTGREDCLYKQRRLQWENLIVTPHPTERQAHISTSTCAGDLPGEWVAAVCSQGMSYRLPGGTPIGASNE